MTADEVPTTTETADFFFAGSVVERKADKMTVARTVLGKTENHTFWMTPETKIDGQLRPKSRVTVRYFSDEWGDTATMIVVRSTPRAASHDKKSKK